MSWLVQYHVTCNVCGDSEASEPGQRLDDFQRALESAGWIFEYRMSRDGEQMTEGPCQAACGECAEMR